MTKEFVTARAAAELLGVDEASVVVDIERGYEALGSLIGGKFGDVWIAYAWQLEGAKLEEHRARLGAADREDGSL